MGKHELICRFEPSETARQNEALQGNTRAEDMIPIIRKKTGPQGKLSSASAWASGTDVLGILSSGR